MRYLWPLVVALAVTLLLAFSYWSTTNPSKQPFLQKNEPLRYINTHKRTMVIHVGPHKHGTTFLQCHLTGSTMNQALQVDNWLYMGRYVDKCLDDRETLPFYPVPVNQSMSDIFRGRHDRIFATNATLHPNFVRALDEAERLDKNAIVISEDLMILSHYMGTMLVDYLHEHEWFVKIVIAYRPLYDYLPSLYSQRVKPSTKKDFFPWPDEPKGRTIEPFDLVDRGKFTKEIQPQVEQGLHKSYESFLVWSASHADAMEFLDMSNLTQPASPADPYLHHFVCRSLQGKAPQTCQATDTLGPPPYSNPSFKFDHDFVATAAYQRGWLGRTAKETRKRQVSTNKTCVAIPRLQAVRETGDFLKSLEAKFGTETNSSLPYNCLAPSKLDLLFTISLLADRNVYGLSDVRESHLRQGFAALVARGKYCWIDAEAALENDSLRRFLQSLAPTDC